MTAGVTPAQFWRLDPAEVVWLIRGYQARLEDQDKLLAFNTINTVAPPMKGSSKRPRPDTKKFVFYRDRDEEEELPLGDDDPNKVIVLEERKKTMQNLKNEFPPKPMR